MTNGHSDGTPRQLAFAADLLRSDRHLATVSTLPALAVTFCVGHQQDRTG